MAAVEHQVGGTFPAGTKVAAYPRLGDVFTGRIGKPHAEGKVDKGTNVLLKGLVDNGPYWLVGDVDGATRAVAFTAHDEETRALPADEAVSQAATRRVAEKVADGAAAVRAGNAALAVEEASSPDERSDSLHAVGPRGDLSVAGLTDDASRDLAEVEQSEAVQAARGVEGRVSGPFPAEKPAQDESKRSTRKTVHGARTSKNSKPTRSKSKK